MNDELLRRAERALALARDDYSDPWKVQPGNRRGTWIVLDVQGRVIATAKSEALADLIAMLPRIVDPVDPRIAESAARNGPLAFVSDGQS